MIFEIKGTHRNGKDRKITAEELLGMLEEADSKTNWSVQLRWKGGI